MGLPTTQVSRGWVITSALSIVDVLHKQVYATVLFDQTASGAADPWGIALSADGRTLWVSLSGVHEAAKLNLAGLHDLLESGIYAEYARLPSNAPCRDNASLIVFQLKP
jgi:hypothetical protein